MAKPDRTYFQRRAEAETDAACRAQHPKAVQAHYLMASRYLDLAHDPLRGPAAAKRADCDGAGHGR